MTDYLILIVIMAIIYFFLVRKRPAPKTDWETLPTKEEYQAQDKATNDQEQTCCIYCGHSETVQRLLNSEKENPDNSKHYHACTGCKVVLWRSVIEDQTLQTKP